jgi:hypothetical protein
VPPEGKTSNIQHRTPNIESQNDGVAATRQSAANFSSFSDINPIQKTEMRLSAESRYVFLISR